jgi:hypothetical protein
MVEGVIVIPSKEDLLITESATLSDDLPKEIVTSEEIPPIEMIPSEVHRKPSIMVVSRKMSQIFGEEILIPQDWVDINEDVNIQNNGDNHDDQMSTVEIIKHSLDLSTEETIKIPEKSAIEVITPPEGFQMQNKVISRKASRFFDQEIFIPQTMDDNSQKSPQKSDTPKRKSSVVHSRKTSQFFGLIVLPNLDEISEIQNNGDEIPTTITSSEEISTTQNIPFSGEISTTEVVKPEDPPMSSFQKRKLSREVAKEVYIQKSMYILACIYNHI